MKGVPDFYFALFYKLKIVSNKSMFSVANRRPHPLLAAHLSDLYMIFKESESAGRA